MDTSNLPEFLTQARFWFSLVNLGILLGSRFGITLTGQEIAAINLVLASAFNIVPPVNGYLAAKRYELKARTSNIKSND